MMSLIIESHSVGTQGSYGGLHLSLPIPLLLPAVLLLVMVVVPHR